MIDKLKHILIVEDDFTLGHLLKTKLGETYNVVLCQNKAEAEVSLIKNDHFDLAILDVGLPDGSGFDVAELLKSKHKETNFIFLTAQSDATSRLKGYELGAEEYIPKPFHFKELLLKIDHVFSQHSIRALYKINGCELNFTNYSLKRDDGSIEYPAASDLKVLHYLILNSPKVLSRDEILNKVWGSDKNMNHRTVDNTIVRLKKLLGVESDLHIRNVRGIGYQWISTIKDLKEET